MTLSEILLVVAVIVEKIAANEKLSAEERQRLWSAIQALQLKGNA